MARWLGVLVVGERPVRRIGATEVRVAMTEAATHFVGPATFQALTGLTQQCAIIFADGNLGPTDTLVAQGLAPSYTDEWILGASHRIGDWTFVGIFTAASIVGIVLGTWLLTELLLPVIRESADGRVITMSSAGSPSISAMTETGNFWENCELMSTAPPSSARSLSSPVSADALRGTISDSSRPAVRWILSLSASRALPKPGKRPFALLPALVALASRSTTASVRH